MKGAWGNRQKTKPVRWVVMIPAPKHPIASIDDMPRVSLLRSYPTEVSVEAKNAATARRLVAAMLDRDFLPIGSTVKRTG